MLGNDNHLMDGYRPVIRWAAPVTQRLPHDSLLCCIAMAAGVSYKVVADRWGADLIEQVGRYESSAFDGWTIDRAFQSLGFYRGVDFVFVNAMRDAKPFLWSRRAILLVPSKCHARAWHAVYWTGQRLYDPARLELYAWDEIKPRNGWLLSEPESWLVQRSILLEEKSTDAPATGRVGLT